MSTILKALRRLEEEKAEQNRPGLRESVVAAPPAASRKLPLFFVVCGVLALGVAAISWWQLSQVPAPQAVAAPPLAVAAPRPPALPVVAAKPAVRAVAPVANLRPARSAPVQPIPEPRIAEPAASVRASSPVIKKTAPLVPAAPVSAPVPAPVPRVAVEAEEPMWAQEVAIVKPRSTPKAKPIPASERTAVRSEPEVTRASLAKVPIPEVVVTRTLWHPLSDRRSATVRVNGEEGSRQMVEGDSVGGLVLLKIEPSGVVFAHDGVQIQRRVGQ
jgi:hypothetical protein